MARVGADLTNIKGFTLVPDGAKRARLDVCKPVVSRNTNNPMIENTWKIVGTEFDGREIRYDNLVLSGISAQGKPISPFMLVQFLEALEVPWKCKSCGVDGVRDFYRGKGPEDDGLEKEKIYCPDCKEAVNIDFDTDDATGKVCWIAVGHRKANNSDKEFNFVESYAKDLG